MIPNAHPRTVLLPSALVVVLATLMIQQAIEMRIAKSANNAQNQKNAPTQLASIKLLTATKSAIMSISSVAVQFTGNLVALGLSEVRCRCHRRARGGSALTTPKRCAGYYQQPRLWVGTVVCNDSNHDGLRGYRNNCVGERLNGVYKTGVGGYRFERVRPEVKRNGHHHGKRHGN
jgi:hypothetical protein